MIRHRMDIEENSADYAFAISDETKGEFAYSMVLRDLRSQGLELGNNVSYLGLGVGASKAESEFSKLIRSSKTVFVDKYDRSASIPKGLKGFSFIQEGLFTYLSKAEVNTYTVITAISVEYIFERKANFIEFLRLSMKVLKKNGFIYIYPANFITTDIDYSQYGLKNISQFPSNYLILLKL